MEPRAHIMEDLRREKFKVQRNQPICVGLVYIHMIFLVMPLMNGSLFHVCTGHHVCPPIRNFLATPLTTKVNSIANRV